MRWQDFFGYTPAIYRWSKWPASYQIISQFCWLITETILACLSQSVFLPPPCFSKDNSQCIVQSAEQVIGCQLPFKKPIQCKKRREAKVELLQTLLTQETTSCTNLPLGYETTELMSWWLHRLPSPFSLLPLALYFPSSLCSGFFHQPCQFLASAHYLIDCVTCHLQAQLFCICSLMLLVHVEVYVTLWLSEIPELAILSGLLLPVHWFLFFVVFFICLCILLNCLALYLLLTMVWKFHITHSY